MRTIILTQNQVALVDDGDFDWLNPYNWYAAFHYNRFYAVRTGSRVNGEKTGNVYMHAVIAERIGLIGSIDHEDRNSLNNQRYNLRVATQAQNMVNTEPSKANVSGYKGVSFNRRDQRWYACISFEKRNINLGYYNTAVEAALAYDRMARQLKGEFAKLNFP